MLMRWLIPMLAATGAAMLMPAGVVVAHAGEPCGPYTLHLAWHWDPLILSGLIVASVLYARGARIQWQRGSVHPWRIFAYTAGLMTLFVALISPVHGVSESLFAGHMIQHMLLVVVAAPLLVYSAPAGTLLLALSANLRRQLGRWYGSAGAVQKAWRVITQPIVAWLLHIATLWGWHAPVFYEAAVRDEFIHAVEHASFFVTALLFWWAAVHTRENLGMGYGHGVLHLFTMLLATGLLGALLTFSNAPWYAVTTHAPTLWGLTPLEDQQLAGLIMWIPAGMVHTFAALALFAAWLTHSERDADARDQKWKHIEKTAE